MRHQNRDRSLGIKTTHSKARSLKRLPRVLEGGGDGSYQHATFRKVHDRVSQRVSYVRTWCWEDRLKEQERAEYKASQSWDRRQE